jgi:predicted MFS family arabinose efflux permease
MTTPSTRIQKRLTPLYVAVFLHGFMLWPPVEKLFMIEIGFDAAAVGLVAAAYAALVPVVEIPSGILADRWSRRGVLAIGGFALMVSALIGGLSHDVPTYVVSALALGVFFALFSGTMDAVVYDTVLEENGNGDEFERRLGRVRLVESVALVSGSLLGGVVASVAEPRTTYLLTVPLAAASVAAYLRFREPTLHRTQDRTPLRRHIAITFRALTRRRRLLPIITLSVLGSVVLQLLLEFGPLWLVALAVPAVLYGPYWAGLVSSLGLGGLLAGRVALHRPGAAIAVSLAMITAAAALAVATSLVVVAVAQVVLALFAVVAGVHTSRLLHDAVSSAVRSSVASGVGALSWIAFLPAALAFGFITDSHGVDDAGGVLVATTAAAGALLVRLAVRREEFPSESHPASSSPEHPEGADSEGPRVPA